MQISPEFYLKLQKICLKLYKIDFEFKKSTQTLTKFTILIKIIVKLQLYSLTNASQLKPHTVHFNKSQESIKNSLDRRVTTVNKS